MSYLLIKNNGRPKGPAPQRNGRRNPSIPLNRVGGSGPSWQRNGASSSSSSSSSLRRAGGVSSFAHNGGGGGPPNRGGMNGNAFNNGDAVVNSGGGQIQLQRPVVATQQQQQQQQQNQQQNQQQGDNLQQGIVSMDDVINDLRILDQQQRESLRMLESTKLTKTHKLEQKKSLEVNLSNVKYQNGEMRAELQRANKELSQHHRQVLDARSRSEKSRKDSTRFDAKLKRTIGVARVLSTYQNKIEAAMIALNEIDARLNFKKGQMMSKVNAANVRRDDAKHRYDLFTKAIQTNQHKERAVKEDLSRIRNEIAGNEHDLSSAQQMESQTKLRVQTIEHEEELEQTRHVDAVADLEAKNTEMTSSKSEGHASIEEKKAAIAAKKKQLREMWEKSSQIRKEEGHEVLHEPKWGVDQVPSLDVARINVRVSAQDEELHSLKSEKENLHSIIVEFEGQVTAQNEEAVTKRDQTSDFLKGAENEREEEERLNKEVNEIVESSTAECNEVSKLEASINDLSSAQEKSSGDAKLLLDKNNNEVSTMETEIESIDEEISALEASDTKLKEKGSINMERVDKEIVEAKKESDVVQGVYERAQKQVAAYNALPDDTLALQMRQLDEAEQDIIDDANRERGEFFELEPTLEEYKFDFNSDEPLEEQEVEGNKRLRECCVVLIEVAREEREARVEEARIAHQAKMHDEKELRLQLQEKKRAKQKEIEKMKLDEEKAAKAEASKLRRQRELEKMRAKSIEMQEKLREEEKDQQSKGKSKAKGSKHRDSKKSNGDEDAESLDADFNRKLKGDAKRREALSKAKKRDAENMDIASKATKKQRTSKSYSKVGKSSSTSNAAPAVTKVRPEPAIKRKDKKDSHRRKSTGSVRFDSSVNKPKVDLFAAAPSTSKVEQKKKKKKSKSSSKISSTQTSGISSSEGAGRRRKKSSTSSGKSKRSALSMGGFDDDGGFL